MGDDLDSTKVPSPNAGAIFVFEPQGAGWSVRNVLRSKGSYQFGAVVAAMPNQIASASLRVCIPGCAGQPDVYVFSLMDGSWVQDKVTPLPRAEETPLALEPRHFGVGGIAFTGEILAVTSFGERLKARGVNPVRDPNIGSAENIGAAYVFSKHHDGWKFDAYLKASNAEEGDAFGASVSASGTTLAIAAPGEASKAPAPNGDQGDNSAPNAGAVYVFSTNCDQVPAGADVPGC